MRLRSLLAFFRPDKNPLRHLLPVKRRTDIAHGDISKAVHVIKTGHTAFGKDIGTEQLTGKLKKGIFSIDPSSWVI